MQEFMTAKLISRVLLILARCEVTFFEDSFAYPADPTLDFTPLALNQRANDLRMLAAMWKMLCRFEASFSIFPNRIHCVTFGKSSSVSM